MKTRNERVHLSEATVALASELGAIESARYFSDGHMENQYETMVRELTEICEDITALLEPVPDDTVIHLTVMEGARA